VGREAIVSSWLSHDDPPATFDAAYSCWAIDGDRAVATGTSEDTVPEQKVYDNVFLLLFDRDGRCDEFTEIYLKHPSG
jgi:hypothetical protein